MKCIDNTNYNTNIHTNNHTHKDSIYKGLKGVDHTDFKYISPGAMEHIRPSKNRVSENISCEIIS